MCSESRRTYTGVHKHGGPTVIDLPDQNVLNPDGTFWTLGTGCPVRGIIMYEL